MQFILLFPGQGSQVVGMGKAWYDASPHVRECFDVADGLLPFRLSDVCFNGPEEVLQETRVCQPALFVVGYAIYRHLKASGIFERHSIVGAAGVSLGELTALACADVFDFETGLRIVAERGHLMQEACEAELTGMLALIGGTDEAIQGLCKDFDLDVSNLNCPGQTVVSGTLQNLEKAQFIAQERGFKMGIPLKVAGAYHSRWMQSAREKFEAFIQSISFRRPRFTVLTNTTGDMIANPADIKKALGLQITSPVLFEKCLRSCSKLQSDLCLECGPGNIIAGLAKRTDATLKFRSMSDPSALETLQNGSNS